MPEDFDTTQNQPIEVFFSYSHKDEALRDELSKHLAILKRQGVISEWHDRQIPPGTEWKEALDTRINQAHIILLLISSDFLASDYCYETEGKCAMERHERSEAIVLPIILRPCSWQGGLFEKLQVLPIGLRPVTTWPNQDEAFTNIVEGIRDAVKRLRQEPIQPTAPPKPRRLNLEQFGADLRRQEVQEIKVANPYLLGDKFVGREKELDDLTDWLRRKENGILCISNLGGTGKSALVWHWLNRKPTRDVLDESGIKQFWCSFYARNYDANQFLRDLAMELGGATIVEQSAERAQRELQRVVLDRLKTEKWLLVLDGLEREMGAFAAPEHYQVDSEEQDRRNEKKEILSQEKYIRSPVFADFLRELPLTQAKVLITTRIFPENLMFGDKPMPGVIDYGFSPMSLEDAAKVWNLCCDPDGSAFQREFFEHIDFHPQVISVVAAAVKEQSLRFSEWFGEFSEVERLACLDANATLTERRHRWLELATRDLIQNRRDDWLTICYIVRRSEASGVESLMDSLVDDASVEASRPGRFRSADKLIEVLNYLTQRRLVGTDFSRGLVDVHPVIRGQVMSYILKQYEQNAGSDEELVRHLESGEDSRELMVRFLNLPDLEARFRSLSSALESFSDTPSAQSAVLNILGKFFPQEPGKRPWLEALPALRLRKDQAWVLYRTGNELMTRGLWDESAIVFKRASIAYQLCGDLQSIEDCRHSHNWQSLYGGALWQSEQQQLDALETGDSKHTKYAPYWLALLLSIRQSEHAAELLRTLPAETNRWTLQTVAEAWFYLEDYPKAATLAQQAWDRREKERDSVGQLLWEAVTLGLALVRMGKTEEAESFLDFAIRRGTGWAYNLVPMFALAGLIELQYREAMKINTGSKRFVELSEVDFTYKRYCRADPNDSFQIPAAEAHLAMARVHLARQESSEAVRLAHRALKIARKDDPPFHYASVVKRAVEFLTGELNQPVHSIETPSLEALDHEDRLRKWMKNRGSEFTL
ncbi:MAG: toll/interleukin-1 receptor domain-containing protein [Acidobacteria bacterium]|nr:toll/interleukin-1 receptor domain-containing protein [Acidobacteriota bacterium]